MGSANWHRFVSPPGMGRHLPLAVEFVDGWVSVDVARDDTRLRVAMSLLGHVQVSASFADEPLTANFGDATRSFDLANAVHVYRCLVAVTLAVYELYWAAAPPFCGYLSGELSEAGGLGFLAPHDWCTRQSSRWGQARATTVPWGDIGWGFSEPQSSAVASCLCDLAVRFRGPAGGVGLSPAIVEEAVQKMDDEELPRARSLAGGCGF
jgi:hypothetical protein